MSDHTTELIDEIAQLTTQYRQEVPGERKTWPESIRSRVIELRRLGLPNAEIAKRTGISYYTVWSWREKKGPEFKPVSIVAVRKAATVTVPRRRPKKIATRYRKAPTPDRKPALSTVTVAISSGVRIEGVSPALLKELLPILTGGAR
jgi:hypothetical protein